MSRSGMAPSTSLSSICPNALFPFGAVPFSLNLSEHRCLFTCCVGESS